MGNERFESPEQRQQLSQGDRTNRRLIADSTLPGEVDPEVRKVVRQLNSAELAAVAPALKDHITPDMFVINHSNNNDGKLQSVEFQNKDGSRSYSVDITYSQGGNAPGKPEEIYEKRNGNSRHTHISYSNDGQIENRHVEIGNRKVSYFGNRLNGPKISEYEVQNNLTSTRETTGSPTERDNLVAWEDPRSKDDSRKTVPRKRAEVEQAVAQPAETTKEKPLKYNPLQFMKTCYENNQFETLSKTTEDMLKKDPNDKVARLFHAYSKVGLGQGKDAANDYYQLSKDPNFKKIAELGIKNAHLEELVASARAAEAKSAKDKDTDKIATKPADTIAGKVVDKGAEKLAKEKGGQDKHMADLVQANKKADADMQKYLRKYPLDAEGWAKQGEIHFNMGRYKEANLDYNQAILLVRKHLDKSSDALDARFWINKGRNDEKLKNYQEANLDYNSALRLSKDDKNGKDYTDAMKAYLDLKQTIVTNKTKDANKVSDTNTVKKNKST